MSFDVLGDLNWPPVIVAAIAYFALGGLWFAQRVFGRAWSRATGIEVPEGERPGAAFFVIPFAVCSLATLATAMLAQATGSDTVGNGVVLGLVVGFGIAAGITLLGVFDPRPDAATWFAIVGGYHVTGLLLVAVIVSVWT